MTQPSTDNASQAVPVIHPPSRLSLAWFLPLIAVAIGAWLFVDHLQNVGHSIQVRFDSAKGMIPDKTEVHYRGVIVGQVSRVALNDSRDKAIVTIVLAKPFADLAREGSQFWIVTPKISLDGIEELGTLISGDYIQFLPGTGGPADSFVALPTAPDGDVTGGLTLILRANEPGALIAGSPVLFHSVPVGRVLRFDVDSATKAVTAVIFIDEKFRFLVHSNSRFWKISGLTMQASLEDIKVDTDSLLSLFKGGIMFETPEPADPAAVADNTEFDLHADYFGAMTSDRRITIRFRSAEGLRAERTMVRQHGVDVGRVVDLRLTDDRDYPVTATVALSADAVACAAADSQFWVVRPKIDMKGVQGIDTLVSGAYIAVEAGTQAAAAAAAAAFTARDTPPPADPQAPGLHLKLTSSVSVPTDTPVLYRKMEVGRVAGSEPAADGESVVVALHIFAPYAALVKVNSRFWQADGFSVEAGLNGVSVKSESLKSILFGGITFAVPPETAPGEPATAAADFRLFASEASAMARGIPFKLQLADATGLQAGRTKIRYRGVDVGHLTALRMRSGESPIEAEAVIDEELASLLRTGTVLSIARPEVSLNGVSNLGTLIEGAFLQLHPGEGEPAATIKVVDSPPVRAGGLRLTLNASRMGSIRVGSPVLYQQLQVGRVIDYQLGDDRKTVHVSIAIRPEYSFLVRQDSRFWHASGINVRASLSGVDIESESLRTILDGGIAFTSPPESTAAAAEIGSEFTLFSSYPEAVDDGIAIRIHFPSAAGIRAGSTEVRYRGVPIGTVKAVRLGATVEDVVAEVVLDRNAAPLATAGASFRLVKPQVSIRGVSGVEDLLTGPYIALTRGDGEPAAEFHAIAGDDALPDPNHPGRRIALKAERLGSLEKGAAIRFRNVDVGTVTGYRLTADGVELQAVILPDYSALVNASSRFWHASGVSLAASLDGINVRAESLSGFIDGAIAFETPDPQAAAVADGREFPLLDDVDAARRQHPSLIVHILAAELGSLRVGAPVYYRQVQVGEIVGSDLAADARQVIIKAGIYPRYTALLRSNSQFWNTSGVSMKFSLIGKSELHAKPIEAILRGGIAFATPEGSAMGPPANAGQLYPLAADPDPKWLEWAPPIPLPEK